MKYSNGKISSWSKSRKLNGLKGGGIPVSELDNEYNDLKLEDMEPLDD